LALHVFSVHSSSAVAHSRPRIATVTQATNLLERLAAVAWLRMRCWNVVRTTPNPARTALEQILLLQVHYVIYVINVSRSEPTHQQFVRRTGEEETAHSFAVAPEKEKTRRSCVRQAGVAVANRVIVI
jgi:hypothetical protein